MFTSQTKYTKTPQTLNKSSEVIFFQLLAHWLIGLKVKLCFNNSKSLPNTSFVIYGKRYFCHRDEAEKNKEELQRQTNELQQEIQHDILNEVLCSFTIEK